MLKNYVLQADIDKDFVGVLSTPEIRKPGELIGIKLPPEGGGAGWTEVRVGIANKVIDDTEGFGESKDITDDVFGTEKVYLGYSELVFDADYKIFAYPFWVVLWVKNKTDKANMYTFQVSLEV